MKVLVTGSAGFIGFHVCMKLLEDGYQVVGLDNINDYYDPKLKKARLDILLKHPKSENFSFIKEDISNSKKIKQIFDTQKFSYVIHLAAQAGVRYSINNPEAYVKSNLIGFMSILEACKASKIKHLIFASSSSVYGMSEDQPFKIDSETSRPVSMYAATKKSNEVLAYSYSSLYNMPITGLRFFTVYGPWGRPDMAYFKFTESIFQNKSIDIYNNGNMKRDFTYIDDVVDGLVKLINKPPKSSSDNNVDSVSYRILNIGNNKPENLNDFVTIIESECGKKAVRNILPMQLGDVTSTYADIEEIKKLTGFMPKTNLNAGIREFVSWYKMYFKIQ